MSKDEKFHVNNLFKILNVTNKSELNNISKRIKISSKKLQYYNDKMIFPSGQSLEKLLSFTGYSELELKIRLGIIDNTLIRWIADNPKFIIDNYKAKKTIINNKVEPQFNSHYGKLYKGDCLDIMKQIPDESINMIFADPPFNLKKEYESGIDDYLSEQEYINWTEKWVLECIRILAPGGSIFVYNLPYWGIYTANILNKYLNFKHWIAIYLRGLMPVPGKLHPSHYALLYYVKGIKPRVFNKQRIPMETCRHCGGEIHDYGGKRKNLESEGLSISDVWTDINPVRHTKDKNREANQLPLKLLYRVISLASNEGDMIFDPFGGSGTTYAVAEYLKRNWIGSEIGEINIIRDRLINNQQDFIMLKEIEKESNVLFTDEQVNLRKDNGFWAYEKLNKNQK